MDRIGLAGILRRQRPRHHAEIADVLIEGGGILGHTSRLSVAVGDRGVDIGRAVFEGSSRVGILPDDLAGPDKGVLKEVEGRDHLGIAQVFIRSAVFV